MNNDILTFQGNVVCGENGRICDFKVITERPRSFSLLEFEMEVSNLSEELNVYYEKDLLISAEITFESGNIIRTRAFYFEEYEINDRNELSGRTKKSPCFRLRINPQEEGKCSVKLALYIKGERTDTLCADVMVKKGEKGSRLLKVEPRRRQTFITASGENFTVVGENVGWNFPIEHRNSFGQYLMKHMTALSRCGGNFMRTWDYLEAGSRIRKTAYTMCQDSSAIWDRVFETAENLGVYISLVMTVHGEVSSKVDSSFALSVWHKNNGGFITDAKDFFTDYNAKDAYKTYIQYITARWGYNEHIIWELFNEIDHTDAILEGNLEEVRTWLSEMAECVRNNDPYGHLVTNSTGAVSVAAALYQPFDFVYYHQYNYYSIGQIADLHKNAWRAYNRPVLIGEFGYDSPCTFDFNDGSHISKDLLVLHQGNWAGVMGGGAGTAMNWWWMDMPDVDGYRSYIGIAKMAKRIPWNEESLVSITHESVSLSCTRIGSMGYCTENSAYLWFYDNNYSPMCRDNIDFMGEWAELCLEGGEYSVEWIDTRSGDSKIVETKKTENGKLRLNMPLWSKDIALVVQKIA